MCATGSVNAVEGMWVPLTLINSVGFGWAAIGSLMHQMTLISVVTCVLPLVISK